MLLGSHPLKSSAQGMDFEHRQANKALRTSRMAQWVLQATWTAKLRNHANPCGEGAAGGGDPTAAGCPRSHAIRVEKA